MDEEALKRNTDCVYFLASPLTCKKGINCEFRHSEAARLHPRECWYWLGGNCLNANCPFRHPPLDGRPASAPGSSAPFKATAARSTSKLESLLPENKSRTPCYYFCQGHCSRGNRCAFLHGSLSARTAQPGAAQKLLEISAGKGPEINDYPMIKDGASIQPATVPSYVFVRAQKGRRIDPPLESLQKAPSVSLKTSNGETPIVKMFKPSVHPKTQPPSNTLSNLPSSHDKSKDDQHWKEDPKCTGVEHVIGMVRSAEAKQFSQGERLQQGTWRERLSKDEPDDLFYSEDNGQSPCHFIVATLSPRRIACYRDAHDFEWAGPEMCDMHLSPDVESYEWPPQVHDNHCKQSFSNLRCDFSPTYLAKDRHSIYDLSGHLGKRRISVQGQFSGFGGHVGAFEDHWYTDESNRIDNMESALGDSEQETSWLNFKRAICKKIQSPLYDHAWDEEEVTAEISSASSSLIHSTRYGLRSKPYCCEDERFIFRKARCHLESDRGRSLWTWRGTPVNAVDETKRKTHSGLSSSYMAHPAIKSQILSASVYDRGQNKDVLNDFEGPKPLSILLQKKQKVK